MSNKVKSDAAWFYAVNFLTTILASCQIILGLIFLLIILSKRSHQSISNSLAMNSAFSITFFAMTVLFISVHMWECDFHPDQCREDRWCFFRDYINDVAGAAVFYSFAVQSVHRLLGSIFVHRMSLRKCHFAILLCFIQWSIAFLYPTYFIYINPQLQFDTVSYVCVIPNNSNGRLIAYIYSIGFLIPLLIIMSADIRLFFSLRRLRRSTHISGVFKEKHIAKRIALLLIILILGTLSGIIFQCVKPSPTFRYRIYYFNVIVASFGALLYLCTVTSVIRRRFLRWRKTFVSFVDCRKSRTILPEHDRY